MKNEILDNEKNKTLFIFLKGAAIGVLVTIASMFIFAILIYFLDLDRRFAVPFSTVSVALGSLAAAHYSAGKIKNRGYLIGLAVGVAVFVLITVISLIVDDGGLSLNTLFHFLIIVLSSAVGGILGVNRSRSKKYI